MFKLGWFLNEEQEVDYDRHPLDFKKQPLQKTATDILGLEFREIIPNISIKTEHEPLVTDKPFVAIATHGTAQAKYWNREGGWQAVVDAIKAKGYDVVMVSREEDGYMGNKNPDGIKYIGASTSFKPAIEHIKKAKLFIGLPSGLTWLSWGLNQQTFMVGGFSEAYTEPESIIKILPKEGICTGCFNEHRITAPWEWCPRHFGTERHFECTKTIEPERVIDIVEQFL
jgi:autotransporter strand-loop-strand O-heptosyltransferase